MKKILYVLLVAAAFRLSAQETVHRLPEVNVTDNRLSIPVRESVHTVTIVTQEEIRALPVHSTAELLQYFAGVDIRRRGIHGVQADAGIRGSSFDQVLILIDGMPMNDPQTGHHNMNLPLDLSAIERIEVIKGPAARIYGPYAFAGAINIVTKDGQQARTSAVAEGGDYGMWHGGVTTTLGTEGIANLDAQASNGYRYNTDYEVIKGFFSTRIRKDRTLWKLTGGAAFRRFGANGFYASPQFKDQYEETQTSLLAVQMATSKGSWTLSPRLFWRRNQDMYLFIRRKPEVYRNMHHSHRLGAELHAKYGRGKLTTGIGLTTGALLLESNNLGKRSRLTAGLFVEERIRLMDEKLELIPGINIHAISDLGIHIFPGIDIGWRLNDHTRLFANAGYTWRPPTYTDLYYSGPTNIGNPSLRPEWALNFEAGIRSDFPSGWQIAVSVFERDGRDIIDWTRQTDTVKWQPTNLSRVDANGIETSIQWHPEGIPAFVNVNYTYTDIAHHTETPVISRYALTHLQHQFNAAIHGKPTRNTSITLAYRLGQRAGSDPYQVWDAGFSWRTGRLEWFGRVSNIFNEQYTETNLVPMPGRWLTGGVRFTMDRQTK